MFKQNWFIDIAKMEGNEPTMTYKKHSDSQTQDTYSDKKLSMIAEKWKG